MFLRFTRTSTDLGVLYLGKTVGDDPFALKVLWKADNSAEVFDDGNSLGTVANVLNAVSDLKTAGVSTADMIHIRACRYDYQFEMYDEELKVTLSNISVATPEKVTYITLDELFGY